MPRRPRLKTSQLVFHVLNRAVQGLTLFESPDEYRHFMRVLGGSLTQEPVRLLAFAVMPNHWHLVLWPSTDGVLASFMQRLTATHAQEWRLHRGTSGRGAVYQGRYKAIVVQHDRHLLQLMRYVERNPLRAKLVGQAEDWPWSSASTRQGAEWPPLTPSPVPRPPDWTRVLNQPQPPATLDRVRDSVRYGRHFGAPSWQARMTRRLKWRQGLRGRGRTRIDLPPNEPVWFARTE